MVCQVAISQADHDFLDWDSFVNCIQAHEAFDLEVIKEQIAADYGGVLKGVLQINVCNKFGLLLWRLKQW